MREKKICMTNCIKVILAEDQGFYLENIKRCLAFSEVEIKVVGEVSNGLQLLTMLKAVTPDIILLDLSMPVMDGNESQKLITELYPDIKIIILSGHEEQALMDDYFLRGVKGYVPKSELAYLVDAIIKVAKGGISKFNKEPANAIAISPRQKQIMTMYASGMSQKEIAKKLKVTRFAIHKTDKIIMKLIGVTNRDAMRTRIIELGFNFLGKF